MSEEPLTDPIPVEYDQAQLDWLESKKLCDQCQSLFDHWYARDNWKSERPDHRHHTLRDLQESARRCPICELWIFSLQGTGSISQVRDEAVREINSPRERGLITIEYFELGRCYTCTWSLPPATATAVTLDSQIELYNASEYVSPRLKPANVAEPG